jgi:exopolyphosphatase / guanosine-5'-triphosphate,3'-diphosphate pyrophosphatase
LKVAALDLGSNTFLCLTAEVSEGRITQVFSDDVEIVRLGQELDKTKMFHPDALLRADLCLQKFSQIIQTQKPEKILAMATAAARDAVNKEELFKLGKKYDIPIEIIAGGAEAGMTYFGAISGLSNLKKNLLVVDIGGRSTEFIFGRASDLMASESYNIGCVSLTEKFITTQPTSRDDIENVTQYIDERIKKAKELLPKHFQLDEILAVAGTPTTLAAAEIGKFDTNRIDGYTLSKETLKVWLERLSSATVEQKIEMGIPAGRADVILVGVITLLRTLEIFEVGQIVVSTRGVRYGVALEIYRRNSN